MRRCLCDLSGRQFRIRIVDRTIGDAVPVAAPDADLQLPVGGGADHVAGAPIGNQALELQQEAPHVFGRIHRSPQTSQSGLGARRRLGSLRVKSRKGSPPLYVIKDIITYINPADWFLSVTF